MQARPRVIMGATHGNEVYGTKAIRRVMDEIESGALHIAAGSVTFVLIVNPLALGTVLRQGVGTTKYMRSTGGYALTREAGQRDDPAAPDLAYRAIMGGRILFPAASAAANTERYYLTRPSATFGREQG